MKTLRILLLLAVTAMLAVVVSDYIGTQRAGPAGGVAEPEEIPRNLDSKASRWTWSQSSANERRVEIHASTVEQIRDTTLLQLHGVELLIYRPDSQSYDRIVSESARFDGETLYSEGEVTVLLGLTPAGSAQPSRQPTKIRSTGVTFRSKTGVASTDRFAEYEFEGGRGHSSGSFYDSVNRYFRMNSQAYVERDSSAPGQPPLKISAGELSYFEVEQRVDLKKGASLERGEQRLEAGEAYVYLEAGVIRRITAVEARGVERQKSRVLRFETPRLEATYSPKQVLERISGEGKSWMTSGTDSSSLRAEGNRIDLRYEALEGAEESLLRETHVRESAVLEARPAAGSTAGKAQIRRISSEILHLQMDSTAENMEFVETLARGRIDLLPVEDGDSHDRMEADRIKMFYAAGNRMEKLQATGNVEVERQPRRNARQGAKPVRQTEPLRTTSGGLIGEFDPASGEMRVLRQWANFRFEQGERSGRAEEARFDLTANRTELRNRAEVWDLNGRTSANQLNLDEESGDFSAQGNVSSVFQERAPMNASGATAKESSGSAAKEIAGGAAETIGPGGELFSTAEPVYATAERMRSNQRSGVIEYFGKARLWQGADRIEAEQIRIERREKKLAAQGNVLSVLAEKHEDAPTPAESAPGPARQAAAQKPPIVVRADAMRYDETTRQIAYAGHVELRRDILRVKASELDAWLTPAEDGESRLKKAEARGAVEVSEAAASGTGRRGFGERAEYHPGEEKVVLEGAPARVINARQDTTRGAELTYYLNDDRLLVLGSPLERSYSLRRKRQE
jgi:lipopolysaccharide export system protein LptA